VFNLVFDREHMGRPWPNLASLVDTPDAYHTIGNTFPWIAPCRIMLYARDHNYRVNVSYITDPIPERALYPVGLAFFDFKVDYFAMMSDRVRNLLRSRHMRVMFYYHEGDNPAHERTRLNDLCVGHELPTDCYIFVSGNTIADAIPGFIYFPDHELFYWRMSVEKDRQIMPGCIAHSGLRGSEFTLLSRVHKWWRASIVTHLRAQGILDRSRWSYGMTMIDDQYQDNPIELCQFENLEQQIAEFLVNAPYTCDNQTTEQHNQHWQLVREHYEESYCHLVLETLYDADGSQGTFLTEKTFKPIRHAQPFVLFAPPGSLALLRRLGYHTFDHAIDNHYDRIMDNTDRFRATVAAIERLRSQDMHAWYQSLLNDIRYNQEYFRATKWHRLDDLATHLDTV
jgi:hypothetical protein